MKKKNLIGFILAAVLIVVLLQNTACAADRPSEAKVPQAAKPVKPQYQLQEEESQSLELKRDPFAALMPPAAKTQTAPASTITLSGILWDEQNPLAIINNKVVKKADSVGGCRVLEIKRNSVVLNDGTRDFELKIGR